MAFISAGMPARSSTCTARLVSHSASAQRSRQRAGVQRRRSGRSRGCEGDLPLVIEAEVLVAGLVAAQGHGSQVAAGVSKGRTGGGGGSLLERASGGSCAAHVCESEVVLGSLSQAQSCSQKRLVSELPLTCGRTRAASDLRAAQPQHVDCQQQRALSRTGGFVSSSKSCAFHGSIFLSETSDAMGAAAVL